MAMKGGAAIVRGTCIPTLTYTPLIDQALVTAALRPLRVRGAVQARSA